MPSSSSLSSLLSSLSSSTSQDHPQSQRATRQQSWFIGSCPIKAACRELKGRKDRVPNAKIADQLPVQKIGNEGRNKETRREIFSQTEWRQGKVINGGCRGPGERRLSGGEGEPERLSTTQPSTPSGPFLPLGSQSTAVQASRVEERLSATAVEA